ncbi:undecaprenyl-diphosphate phosphatase [Methanolobus halotolerans]|uniref:Undecaprenyl-diphosphatase n=1 Tax=Methanolobus halotolerans TaxID=2052935 RepID=A0A4E0Q7I4_9EURY|nr:undecaprenyl-diphosphate phosphatase [Methanolobus halotolerans]TGC10930.1 UDP-diphosphatase [Methanolobus halotolerans]
MLTLFEAVVLGIVQGVAEWLPISSEGMTSLVMINVFGKTFAEALPISIWLHTGTLFSAAIYFRKDLLEILYGIPGYVRNVKSGNKQEQPLISFLIISTLLTGLVGLPLIVLATNITEFSGKIATAFIGLLLIFTGVLQITASARDTKKHIPLFGDSLVTGIAQGFAALPGISRSGITVSSLLLRNFQAPQALRLSFLMSIPTVLVADVGIAMMGMLTIDANSLIALCFAFIFGILSIDAFIKIAQKFDFARFCIVLGLLSLLAYFI